MTTNTTPSTDTHEAQQRRIHALTTAQCPHCGSTDVNAYMALEVQLEAIRDNSGTVWFEAQPDEYDAFSTHALDLAKDKSARVECLVCGWDSRTDQCDANGACGCLRAPVEDVHHHQPAAPALPEPRAGLTGLELAAGPVCWLWHGGSSYSRPDNDDAEDFETLDALLDEFEARTRDSLYPCVDAVPSEQGGPEAWIMCYPASELRDDVYPDLIVSFDPNGDPVVSRA